jgi:hypothetical protein
MALSINEATGRACCKICNEKIAKDEPDVEWSAWREGGHYHLFCLLNGYLKRSNKTMTDLTNMMMTRNI